MRSHLSTRLAHELRNPLNSAQLLLEVLTRRLRRVGKDELVEPAREIRHELERLDALIDDFLEYAEPPRSLATPHDLVSIVSRAVAVEHVRAAHGRVDLRFSTSSTEIEVVVDAAQIMRLVENLVRNAVEATGPGGHVGVIVTESSTHVQIAVQDEGCGIPDEVMARIYEPFFTTKHAGTGLGLTIVQTIVSQHRGTIAVETSPNGTRVVVELPRR